MSQLKPKFLTKEVADQAMNAVWEMVSLQPPFNERLKRLAFHVTVLGPEMDHGTSTYPNYPIRPIVIAEQGFGDKNLWSHDFAEIAQCKALQLWHDRNNGATTIMPHLLFPNDTPFWGGVKRDGIVVACSGVQAHFDRMIAGMVADGCVALAYDAYKKWSAENPDADFV